MTRFHALRAMRLEGDQGPTTLHFDAAIDTRLETALWWSVHLADPDGDGGAALVDGQDFWPGTVLDADIPGDPAAFRLALAVAGDTQAEADEWLSVTLNTYWSLPGLRGGWYHYTAETLILNDDPISLTQGGATARYDIAPLEADRTLAPGGLTPFTFLVSREGDLSGAATLRYAVRSMESWKLPLSAFEHLTGTLSFAPGEAEAVLTLLSRPVDFAGTTHFAVTLSGVGSELRVSAEGVVRRLADFSGPDGLFNADWYGGANPDVLSAAMDPLLHFEAHGWREGRDPNPLFDTDAYLAWNPDVAAAGVDPLRHYAAFGWREGRAAGPDFDGAAYLAANPDVAVAGMNPLAHYLHHGQAEGRAAFAAEAPFG